jgi:hypothetical protein
MARTGKRVFRAQRVMSGPATTMARIKRMIRIAGMI